VSQDSEQVQDEAPDASESAEETTPSGVQGDPAAIGDQPDGPTEPIGPVITDALDRIVGALRVRGRAAAERGARSARRRMDLYQSRRDLDKLYQKLGREVIRLVEAGEVTHPGLKKGVERVRKQEAAVELATEIARAAPPEELQAPTPEDSDG